ncbi:ribonuclease H-like domain-containing protein [Tanacetum coccineum]
MMSQKRRITHASENSALPDVVLTNDEVLTEILIRLPILCIHLFTIVSKEWLRILKTPDFTRNHSQITKVDPHIGLFVNHIKSLFECDFVSLDLRLQSKKSALDSSFTLGSTKEADNVKILQSCNDLLLCSGSGRPVFYYVYNPSTNQYRKLSHPDFSLDNSPYYRSAKLRMAFDPTKSQHYKLVDAGRTSCCIDIQIYSSEIGNWSLCKDRFNYFSFNHFDSAIYYNDALHWLETENRHLLHYRLNIEDHEHPILTTIQIPQRGMNFLESYGYTDPMVILIQIPHMLHLEGKLFESRGCLLLIFRDDTGFSKFTIYEMMIGCFIWTVRYRVDIDDFMTPLLECWSIRSTVWSIVWEKGNKILFW